MGEDIWHPPEVHAAWESGRRQGHLDKAGEISAAIAERDALRAEVERLRGLVKSVKRHADEWAISRMTGSKSLEQQKADLLWQEIRRASASTAPIEASAALGGDT